MHSILKRYTIYRIYLITFVLIVFYHYFRYVFTNYLLSLFKYIFRYPCATLQVKCLI